MTRDRWTVAMPVGDVAAAARSRRRALLRERESSIARMSELESRAALGFQEQHAYYEAEGECGALLARIQELERLERAFSLMERGRVLELDAEDCEFFGVGSFEL